jgi:hypothetical protein
MPYASRVVPSLDRPRLIATIRDYVRLTVPEPDVLRAIGEESRRHGTDKLTSRQIDRVIKAARARTS